MFATTRSPISTGFAVLAALGLCSTGALAHLQMQNPLPIDSPLGSGQPKNGEPARYSLVLLKLYSWVFRLYADGCPGQSYSYTAPLSLDGSEYPCKVSTHFALGALSAHVKQKEEEAERGTGRSGSRNGNGNGIGNEQGCTFLEPILRTLE